MQHNGQLPGDAADPAGDRNVLREDQYQGHEHGRVERESDKSIRKAQFEPGERSRRAAGDLWAGSCAAALCALGNRNVAGREVRRAGGRAPGGAPAGRARGPSADTHLRRAARSWSAGSWAASRRRRRDHVWNRGRRRPDATRGVSAARSGAASVLADDAAFICRWCRQGGSVTHRRSSTHRRGRSACWSWTVSSPRGADTRRRFSRTAACSSPAATRRMGRPPWPRCGPSTRPFRWPGQSQACARGKVTPRRFCRTAACA